MERKEAQLTAGEKLWLWFEANKKQAIVGVIAVALAALVISFYLYNEGRKREEAALALSEITSSLILPTGTKPQLPEAYLKVASEYSGTKAAGQAILLAGETLFTQGKFAEAQQQFQRFSRENAGNPLVAQALLGVAASLEAQGKIDEALRAYKEVGDRFPTTSLAAQAKYSQGRILESQGQLEDARNLYEEVMRSDNSSIGSEAGMRFQQLRMKTLAAAPPAPASPAAGVGAFTNLTSGQTN